MHEINANILIRTVKHNAYTIGWIRTLIVNNLFQVSVNFDIDCEPSLFFLQRAMRVRGRQAAKPRDARNEGLSRLAPSVTHVCILARFVRRTKKKERLLVV